MTGRTIKRIADTEIIEVRYAGEITYSYRLGTLDALEAITPTAGLRRLLINYTSAWPAAQQREPRPVTAFGIKLGSLRFVTGARIALVNAPSELGARTEKAIAAGRILFQQFSDRDIAIEWLS